MASSTAKQVNVNNGETPFGELSRHAKMIRRKVIHLCRHCLRDIAHDQHGFININLFLTENRFGRESTSLEEIEAIREAEEQTTSEQNVT